MITYTQAYQMVKQAASEYEKKRDKTISSAESKARSTGVKPMDRKDAEKEYDKSYAAAARKRVEEDRAKRKAENNRHEEARQAERQKHLNNSRYLNSQYGKQQQAQLQGQLDKQKDQYAARTAPAPKTQVASAPAKKPVTRTVATTSGQKRAPGIYNAQGQRWNGKAFV